MKLEMMAMACLTVMATALMANPGAAAVVTQSVEYRDGEVVLEGYLAYDDALQKDGLQAKRPGVLVAHEWRGLSPQVKTRAGQLAQLGYVAFALDMYGKGVYAKDNKEAAMLAGKYKGDRALMRRRALAGLDVLRRQPLVDATRMAAIGYCFGGTTVLEVARSGADIAGVVSFHGGLDSPAPADAKHIKARVLVLHGADDPSVPPAQVAAFEDEMRAANVDWQLVKYGGAVHSFTNIEAGTDASKGNAYNAYADRRSWRAMQDFFAEIFKP